MCIRDRVDNDCFRYGHVQSAVLERHMGAAVEGSGHTGIGAQHVDGQTGVMGSEIIFLAVQNPGNFKVTMEYKRGWEMMGVQQFSFDIAAQ